MRVVRDGIQLCTDCMILAVNGDESGLTAERAAQCYAGLEALGPHLVEAFDSESGEGEEEFSNMPCEACGTGLSGARYEFAVLA